MTAKCMIGRRVGAETPKVANGKPLSIVIALHSEFIADSWPALKHVPDGPHPQLHNNVLCETSYKSAIL